MSPAQSKIAIWRRDPTQFVRDQFGAEPDVWQQKVLTAFGDQAHAKMRIALRACVGPGKSTVEAWCGWNFLSCYGEVGNHPKGAVVSVTKANLSDNLFPEFQKWRSRSEWLLKSFEWTKERIFSADHPETWFLSARSFNKDANPEEQGRTLSGLHSKFVLALIDESGEIPVAVLKAAEQSLAERDCAFARIVQSGNPSSLDGMLYAAANQLSHLWRNFRVTGDPDDPDRSPRIDIEWAKEQISLYGRENPWVKYSILGEFPESSINSLLGVDEVEAAMGRTIKEDAYMHSQKRLGMDIAFQGDDMSVIFPRQGLASFRPIEMRNLTSSEQAARLISAKTKFESEIEFVDDTGGWAKGVHDFLVQAGCPPIPINFSGKSIDPRYYNKRSEMYFEMAKWVKRGGCLPPVPELVPELTKSTYCLKNGKFLLEPKELIKKKLGRSPDRADALCLTFALPEMPAALRIPGAPQPGKMLSDYDPYEETRL